MARRLYSETKEAVRGVFALSECHGRWPSSLRRWGRVSTGLHTESRLLRFRSDVKEVELLADDVATPLEVGLLGCLLLSLLLQLRLALHVRCTATGSIDTGREGKDLAVMTSSVRRRRTSHASVLMVWCRGEGKGGGGFDPVSRAVSVSPKFREGHTWSF